MSVSLLLEAAEAAHGKGHFGYAGDLLTRLLSTDGLSASVRSDTCTALAAAKRSNGHLRDALLAAQQAQNEVGLMCSCEAHYEEGAVWQELDCAELAAACFERALAKDPSHEPSHEASHKPPPFCSSPI